jgi:DNA helicase II / ATP-dependent DNA helicase PcrA
MFVWNAGELNPEQEAAVTEDRSVFLTACPGSGKTRTLTYKIARELSQLQSDRQWVVAITYTHRAADEISARIDDMGLDSSRLWVGTIHSFCLEWILRPYGIYHPRLKNGFRIINGHDTETRLAEICRPYNNPRITPWDCGHHYTPAGLTLTCYEAKRDAVADILARYHDELFAEGQIDFELMLCFAHELLASTPSIARILASLFSWILIDEFQDTKEIQYAIVAALLRAGGGTVRTFIVGDANQAIYGTLGGYAITAAEFSAMATVDLKEMNLSRNYRSSRRVVEYFGNYNVLPTAISAAAKHRDYESLISFDDTTSQGQLEEELIRLIRYNIETLGIAPAEVCVLAPQWVHLASMTRRLVAAMGEYQFDGPGMVPFARDIDNFWYKLAKIVLTEPSPGMYVKRLRWAADILATLDAAGVSVLGLSRRRFLRECNSIALDETNGLSYLEQFFDALFLRLGIDFRAVSTLKEHHDDFFASSRTRIERLTREGTELIAEIGAFRKVFANRSGITVSTIHGVKGTEFDAVIAYALLEGMVPHFNDPSADESAKRLLYVICSRARKNLHLISERGRIRHGFTEYQTTTVLADCVFTYDNVP